MLNKQLNWCFKIKDGLKFIEPNEDIAESYLSEAKISLKRAEAMLKEKDFLWATVIAYYAEYYALYSFLQKIGVKCENHFCSILAVKSLLGEEKTKVIEEHKDKRVDAQYYMKVVEGSAINEMLKEAKKFVSEFDILYSNLTKDMIQSYRSSLAGQTDSSR